VKADKLDQFLNNSNGEEHNLLDELRVNKESIFLKIGKQGDDDDFGADLKFDPSQI